MKILTVTGNIRKTRKTVEGFLVSLGWRGASSANGEGKSMTLEVDGKVLELTFSEKEVEQLKSWLEG